MSVDVISNRQHATIDFLYDGHGDSRYEQSTDWHKQKPPFKRPTGLPVYACVFGY